MAANKWYHMVFKRPGTQTTCMTCTMCKEIGNCGALFIKGLWVSDMLTQEGLLDIWDTLLVDDRDYGWKVSSAAINYAPDQGRVYNFHKGLLIMTDRTGGKVHQFVNALPENCYSVSEPVYNKNSGSHISTYSVYLGEVHKFLKSRQGEKGPVKSVAKTAKSFGSMIWPTAS